MPSAEELPLYVHNNPPLITPPSVAQTWTTRRLDDGSGGEDVLAHPSGDSKIAIIQVKATITGNSGSIGVRPVGQGNPANLGCSVVNQNHWIQYACPLNANKQLDIFSFSLGHEYRLIAEFGGPFVKTVPDTVGNPNRS